MKRFESWKTITELWIDTTRKFVVVNWDYHFSKWDILELINDDDSYNPKFSNQDWEVNYYYLEDIYYADEQQEPKKNNPMKRYEAITAGELRKMDGRKCRFETPWWVVVEDWIISVNKNWRVYILHNNPKADWRLADDLKWKKFSWITYLERIFNWDDYLDNSNYSWIEIEETQEIKQEKPKKTISWMATTSEWVTYTEDTIQESWYDKLTTEEAKEQVKEWREKANKLNKLIKEQERLFSKKYNES